MCEVLNVDMTPHASNTRAACVASAENFSEFEPMFGLEQEYTFYEQSYDSLKYGQPLGFPPSGYPAPKEDTTVVSEQTKYMVVQSQKITQLLVWKLA